MSNCPECGVALLGNLILNEEITREWSGNDITQGDIPDYEDELWYTDDAPSRELNEITLRCGTCHNELAFDNDMHGMNLGVIRIHG